MTPELMKKELDEAELDRLAFVVYKKALSLIGYTATVFSIGLAVFAYFGFSEWNNISKKLAAFEESIKSAEERANSAEAKLKAIQTSLSEIGETSQAVEEELGDHRSALKDTFVETGKMMRVKEEMDEFRNTLTKDLDKDLSNLQSNQQATQGQVAKTLLKAEEDIAEVKESNLEFQRAVRESSEGVKTRVERARYAGLTVVLFQAKDHRNNVPVNGTDIQVTMGRAVEGLIENVSIDYDQSGRALFYKTLRENEVVRFSRIDKDGIRRAYTFKILNINLLLLRDLVTCELRWEIDPGEQAGEKAAEAG